jgi:Flp pilus assembly protein TadD
VVLGLYLLRKHGWKFHRILIGTALALVAAAVTFLAVIRLEGIVPPQRVLSSSSSVTTTVPLWRSAITMAARNPLIGVGPGMFPWRYPEFRGQQGSPDAAGSNDFTWLAEYGIIGGLLALSALVTFCIAAVQILNARAKRYSASTNSNRYAFTVAGLAIIAAAVVDTVTTSGFDACANQLTLVVLLGATLTCGLHNRNEHPDKTHIPGKHTVFRLTSIHRVMLTGGSLLALALFLWLLINTSPGEVLLARAVQCAAQKDFGDAEMMYRRAIRADERNFAAITGLADLHAARREPNDHERALSLYERALVLNPYAHHLHLKIAGLYDDAGNREQAAEQLQLAVQSDPRNAAYHVARAQHHLRWKEDRLAEVEFQRAAALDPTLAPATTNAPPTGVEP